MKYVTGMLCLLIAASAAAQSRSGAMLQARFSGHLVAARETRLGIFRMPQESKNKLDRMHYRLMGALRSGNDPQFRAALLDLWEVPRNEVVQRGAIVKGFSQGSGEGGSSNTFAKGMQDGVTVASYGLAKFQVQNDVMCVYLYGPELSRCKRDNLGIIYARLKVGAVTIAGLNKVLNR